MENKEKAIIMKHHYSTLNQDAPFMLRATGKFEWFEGYSEPDESTLEEWKTDMVESLKSTEYIGKRSKEYPSIGDQLDYIYHNGVAAWKTDIIKPIKDKYPKPQEES